MKLLRILTAPLRFLLQWMKRDVDRYRDEWERRHGDD